MSTTHKEENTANKSMVKRRAQVIAFAVLGLALLVLGAFWFMQQIYQANLQRIDASKYQVVYLVNGQAYFGKLQNTSGDFLVLKSPYIAQSVDSAADDSSKAAGSTQTTILKVTDQVYGPDDSIAIKTSQVAFWQNLRDDSKVTKAIDSQK